MSDLKEQLWLSEVFRSGLEKELSRISQLCVKLFEQRDKLEVELEKLKKDSEKLQEYNNKLTAHLENAPAPKSTTEENSQPFDEWYINWYNTIKKVVRKSK